MDKHAYIAWYVAFLLWFAAATISHTPGYAASVIGQTTFGTAGDETGKGITADGSGVYFAGYIGDGNQGGLVGQYAFTLPSAPTWSRLWSGAPNSGRFFGIAAHGSGIVAAGGSDAHTVDTRGSKEMKGITVQFNTDGTPGAGLAGAVWVRQTPAPPGGFPYGGIEWLTGVSTGIETGQPFLYTAAVGERFGFTDQWGTFVTKLDTAGNVLWSRNDFTPTRVPTEPAVIATGDGVVMATRNDSSGTHPYLKKYDIGGNLLWAHTSTVTGEYLGVALASNHIIAVGQSGVGTPNTDFLIESWDRNGNLLWSRSYDRSLAEDLLDGVIIQGSHVFAVGTTRGGTAGGLDAVLLDIDVLTGNLLNSTLWGGSADDLFSDVTIADGKLFAVGTTSSIGAGGKDIALVSFALPQQTPTPVPEPSTLLLLMTGLVGLLGYNWRRRIRGE